MEAVTNQYSIYNTSQRTAFCEAQYAEKQLRNLILLYEEKEDKENIH